MSNLTAGIRRAATPDRATGRPVPSTAGVNDGDPTLQSPTPTRTVGAAAPAFPKSEGAHKSNGWHELTDVEIRAYTETIVALTVAGGQTLTIDPTRVQVWRVAVTGNGATIIIPKPTFPSPSTARKDATERRRTWSCVLIVAVSPGIDFPTVQGALWSEKSAFPNIKNPDGSDPTDYGGVYAFTFLFDPLTNLIYGFEGGLRL